MLLITFILFSIAPLVHSLDAFFFDDWSLTNLGYIIGLGYSMAMVFASVANLFLARFIKILFEETPKIIVSLAVVDIIFVLIFAIFKSLNRFLESTLLLGLHVLVSLIIYLYIFRKSLQIASKVDKKIDKRGLQFIGLIGVFLSLLYILFAIEAILFFGQFSILAVFAWLCGVLGAFCGYIGFCRPNWFKKKYG